jgi:hypothetical protein
MNGNTGRCLCGAVTYEGKGTRSAPDVCHCRDCRRWAGSPALMIHFSDGIDISGDVLWFRSSDWAERGSCPSCGAAMFYRLTNGSGFINVSAGSLDDQALPAIREQIFIESKPAYYDLAGDAPRITGAEVFARFQSSQESGS